MLYRPSDGRRGGASSPEFGEFDFVILSASKLYLGESKWDALGRRHVNALRLGTAQLNRHRLMRWYVDQWFNRQSADGSRFLEELRFAGKGPPSGEPLPSATSLLWANRRASLEIMNQHYAANPSVENMLLYLHKGPSAVDRLASTPEGFRLVSLDYSENLMDSFIPVWYQEGPNYSR